MPHYPPLDHDIETDVCIVGAGISGMTTAYLLLRDGKRVVVIDDGPVGGGETGRTTAHITCALDDRYLEIERLHGEEGARIAAESHTAAIDAVEVIVREEGIDCDFERVNGYLFVPPGESTEILGNEMRAAHRAGLTGVEYLRESPFPFFNTGDSLRFPRQAQFHPLKYLRGLAEGIVRMGGRLHTGTHADEISGGSPAIVRTRTGAVITAGAVVVATNSPVNNMFAIHTKQAPYRTYVIGARVPAGSVPKGLYWDTPDPYHYIRLESDGASAAGYDILIVGGEDHKTGTEDDAEERYRCLEEWARERFPMIESVEYRWSGQVMEPVDGMAFIGRNPMDTDNVYVITGDSGNGMTHGTIGGILITDLIMGRENHWAVLYDPSRITLKATPDFLKEGKEVVEQLAAWVTPGEVDSVEDIPAGEGRVIRRGLKKIAAYRDPQGVLHERSAACTHLGCVLEWNSEETSWDCPCHGSRFDPYGKILNGPAIRDLPPADD